MKRLTLPAMAVMTLGCASTRVDYKSDLQGELDVGAAYMTCDLRNLEWKQKRKCIDETLGRLKK